MDALSSLRVYLENPPLNKGKAPRGLDAQLKATLETFEAATPNVWLTLLQAGFQAWYAYFVADPKIRSIVDGLPALALQNLAEELCKVKLHKDIEELFEHLLHTADRGEARCRTLRKIESKRVPGEENGQVPEIGSSKRRRTNLTQTPNATAEPAPVSTSIALSAPLASAPVVEQALSVTSTQAVESGEGLTINEGESLPFATHLSSIFPPPMLSSIVKTGNKAEVHFLDSEISEKPRLRLLIYPHRIPYLAKEIFDVDADIQGMLMHLRLDNGATAKVLELDGATHVSLDKCFGIQVAAAIRSTRTFKTEVDHGQVVTKCVALEVNPCSLSLMLDPQSLSVVVAQIWPEKR